MTGNGLSRSVEADPPPGPIVINRDPSIKESDKLKALANPIPGLLQPWDLCTKES